jgi:hypothetical protein
VFPSRVAIIPVGYAVLFSPIEACLMAAAIDSAVVAVESGPCAFDVLFGLHSTLL